MLDRESAEALFLQHLDWIDRVAAIAWSKHGIRGVEAEDFTSWVRMKLMEDDFAVLRRFQGASEVKTYLATVVVRHLIDHVRELRGRWRPSAAAERLGAPASDLERLVHRDGYMVQQAGEKLRTAGITTLSDAELARLLASLPVRSPLRPMVDPLDAVVDAATGDSRADERVVAEESDARRAEIMGALDQALGQMEAEEQLVARLHFGDGLTVAEVARALRLEQKPLYRRVERLRARLRALLEDAGVRGDDVRSLLESS